MPEFVFGTAETEQDYWEVLALRHLAYKAAGKVSENSDPSDLGDEFDARSIVVTVRENGKLVASARIAVLRDGDTTDHGRYAVFPADFPPLSQLMESSRVCTDPAHRGNGLFPKIMAHLMRLAVANDRRYVFGGAAGTLIPMYERYGAKVIGEPYRNPSLSGIEHRLILLDAPGILEGRGVSPELWARVYA
ncbi:GNAT family N-acetyltransferase [bacterium]|nr:GNAT family N-acetyltransferase [bacterium]